MQTYGQPDITSQNLPPELQDVMDEMKANKLARVEAIGKKVAKLRDEAVKHRKQSGIEAQWEEDEEYYQGIDDANRSQLTWTKSASNQGGISREPKTTSTRCTSFFNITRQFVESASARMGDILLPSGDWNFAIKATPVQDDQPGQQPQATTNPDGTPLEQLIPAAQVDANRRAEKGELWIQDKLVECSYHTEVRKVIEDAAKLGTGVLKGPFPKKVTSRKASIGPDGKFVLTLVESTPPASKHVDVWDFFPDPACGENIHDGSHTLERDRLNAKKVKDLKGMPGYLDDQIDLVLEQGPNKKCYDEGIRNSEQVEDSEEYTVWYFNGLVDVSDLSAMNVTITEDDSKKEFLPAVVTLINDTAIKAHISPMDSGEFPYDLMPWQRVAGQPWGVGVARQGRTAQDMLNGSARALMDNAGLASGPMIVMRSLGIRPADGKWEIAPRKVWLYDDSGDAKSMDDIFKAINIPMVQAELSAIITLAYKMMEDATGIFFIMQGQQGSAPDTVGGMELLHRNASAILRRLARVFDERVTEPHIRRYYEWMMIHGPEDAKGDMKVEAVGSTSLVEREIQTMESMVLLQMSVNPAFGLDPESAMEQVLLSKRFIPDKWMMDPAKKKAQQPATVPAIEIQKMKSADLDKQLAQEKDIAIAAQTLKKHGIDVDQNREDIFEQGVARRSEATISLRVQELQLKKELAMLQYATEQNISLDKIKSDLSKTAMTLRVQKELAGVTQAAEQVAPTTMEPAGRADPGQAFQE